MFVKKVWCLFLAIIALPVHAVFVDPEDDSDSSADFVVAIRASTYAEEYRCGGTILNKRWVLTAAHCLVTSGSSLEISTANPNHFSNYDVVKPKELSVTAGQLDLTDIEISDIYTVSHVVIHSDYNPIHTTSIDELGQTILEATAYQNDIALLYVDRDLPDTTVTLLTSDNYERFLELELDWDPAIKTPNLTVIGWGETKISEEEDPNLPPEENQEESVESILLKETDIAFMPLSDCYNRLESAEDIPLYIASPMDPTKLCTLPSVLVEVGDKIVGNGACVGDTGGPLIWDDNGIETQVGIISASSIIDSVCSSVTLPTWYTNVNTFLLWIESYINDAPPENVITKPNFLIPPPPTTEEGTTDETEEEQEEDNSDTIDIELVEDCSDATTVTIGTSQTQLGCSGADNGGSLGQLWLVTLMGLALYRSRKNLFSF